MWKAVWSPAGPYLVRDNILWGVAPHPPTTHTGPQTPNPTSESTRGSPQNAHPLPHPKGWQVGRGVTLCCCFFLAMPHGTWDLSSLTRD